MELYYDKAGQPISAEEWAPLFADKDYQRVECTSFGDRHGCAVIVSTVWLGINHCWSGGDPIIFETMVFGCDDEEENPCWRYSTQAEAEAGHWRVVGEWGGPSDVGIQIEV